MNTEKKHCRSCARQFQELGALRTRVSWIDGKTCKHAKVPNGIMTLCGKAIDFPSIDNAIENTPNLVNPEFYKVK